MSRQILSQEEINALLNDSDSASTQQLTPLQKDALGEIGNISYGAASTALSEILNRRVTIDTPTVFITTQQELKEQHPIPYVIIEVEYINGLMGTNLLILKVRDSAIIADLMMGGDGRNPNESLGDMELSAIAEALNQMAGTAATSLSTLFSKRVAINPPRVKVINFKDDDPLVKDQGLNEKIVVVSFKLEIQDLTDSEMMLVVSYPFGVEMADSMIKATEVTVPKAAQTAQTSSSVQQEQRPKAEQQIPLQTQSPLRQTPPIPTGSPISQPVRNEYLNNQGVNVNRPVEPGAYNMPPLAAASRNINYGQEVPPQVMVQPAQFAPLGNSKLSKETNNIGLILDVPLQVTVELGNTRMRIKEILELGVGSIVELDKLAGDPVDIYVNGKLIAKGEVVVIDENFGIKVTDIISPIERVNTLQ
ncbi:MAG TPA: flagellar motor switch phosphatase FliY [Firmicutes bacterium]|nr:flagellar motor switch phosphatase FliY [Bacillota bacterium]